MELGGDAILCSPRSLDRRAYNLGHIGSEKPPQGVSPHPYNPWRSIVHRDHVLDRADSNLARRDRKPNALALFRAAHYLEQLPSLAGLIRNGPKSDSRFITLGRTRIPRMKRAS